MTKCQSCDNVGNNYSLTDSFFYCDKCLKSNLESFKINTETIKGKPFYYFLINDNKVFIIDCDVNNSKLKLILGFLKENKTNNVYDIFFSKDKNTSLNLIKEVCDNNIDLNTNIGSRYSIIEKDGKKSLFFNLFSLDSSEFEFLIKFIDIIKLEDVIETNKRLTNIYSSIIFNQNKNIGINFACAGEDLKKHLNIFNTAISTSIPKAIALNSLKDKYAAEVKEYILRQVTSTLNYNVNEANKKLPLIQGVIELIFVTVESALFDSILSSNTLYLENLKKEINVVKDDVLKEQLLKLYEEIKKELDLSSESKIIDHIEKTVVKYSESISRKYISMTEISFLIKKLCQFAISFELNSNSDNSHDDEIMNELNQVKYTIDLIEINYVRYLLTESWIMLAEKICLARNNLDLYKEIVKRRYANLNLITNNLKEINSLGNGFPKIKEDDVALTYSGFAFFAYCMKDFNLEKELLEKLVTYVNSDSISSDIKISIMSQLFFKQEDYDSLKNILKSYTNRKNYVNVKSDSIMESLGFFSEAFFETDYAKKVNFYDSSIESIGNTEIQPISFYKSINENKILIDLITVFKSFDCSLFQNNSLFFVSEIKNAVNILNQYNEQGFDDEPPTYYYLKSKIVYDIITTRQFNYYALLNKLKNFKSKSCDNFITFLNLFRDVFSGNETLKLIFLKDSLAKKYDDLWIRVLLKFLDMEINYDFFNTFTNSMSQLSNKTGSELLTIFKNSIENGCITSFWKNKENLNSNAEDIGRNLLWLFLNVSDRYNLHKEEVVNRYKVDLLAVTKKDANKAILIETKIYNNKSYYEAGFSQIKNKYEKYLKHNYELEVFYVVFCNIKVSLPEEIEFEGLKIKIVYIDIS
jgi:hypothetical protein